MSLGVDGNLADLVRAKYTTAKASGAVVFAETELAIVRLSGVAFQVRYAPGLAKKPLGYDLKASKSSAPKPDPFDNPPEELLVARVPGGSPTHTLVLNKFPIIDNHFILATIENKLQTSFLEEVDLELTYNCLKAWAESESPGGKPKLFAFFNSGRHSGASQPHRHVQFIPSEDMTSGETDQWPLLVDAIVFGPHATDTGELSFFRTHRDLPFKHFGTRLPPNATPMMLRQLYMNLYDQCESAVKEYAELNPGKVVPEETEDGSLPISYNLAMTTTSMVMCPRISEGLAFKREDGDEIAYAALNGTTLGGTVLSKDEWLFKTLQQAENVEDLLGEIGIPTLSRQQSLGTR
ncbi:hypothetical protein FH972_025997 [Carpinus fangiana]|uniref:Uncharacterized protein n=1 Tax=Carpinus fangiana TaxID=176857 RepID=A0A5N6L312_9ROSI|nr:hypothetical protein FH972_025997 [Carpinus fangiana]